MGEKGCKKGWMGIDDTYERYDGGVGCMIWIEVWMNSMYVLFLSLVCIPISCIA